MSLSAATRHGYILAILIPPYAFHGVYIYIFFFPSYEGKSGIKIVDGERRKLQSSYARATSCRIFRKNTFKKIRPRWHVIYVILLYEYVNIMSRYLINFAG